ncbi:MAG: 50S ribosomal protein L18 [Candidatus Marinimicrobia bacterium]|nr:50S ribosomal protein L18 [Candidatus Neomarinimicrobiota bacterium]MBL7023065.1 50S ribosomal protein L18 [Candidatus Neomarinimicrobiota bacterium]MBL7109085.1 50S ribosomal protein L18 [Candidatus Neomarinimicrobiota bacterium]
MAYKDKRARWENKRRRIKSRLKIGTNPRLVVFRSNSHIYAQIIDDVAGKTLVSTSTLENDFKKTIEKSDSKTELSKKVGKNIAEKALKDKITQVIFDRNGYEYHGRVKALADAAREAGLKF